MIFRYPKVRKQECLNISENVSKKSELPFVFVLQRGGEVQILENLMSCNAKFSYLFKDITKIDNAVAIVEILVQE